MIETLFGSGKDLDALQMAMRALVMFFLAVAMVRIAGMRAFGRKAPFDTVIVIMLGAVLSRAVIGASAFWPTLAAGGMLVVVHRAVAMLCARWRRFEQVIKGSHCVLYRDGAIDWPAMRRHGITRSDLEEAVRSRAHAKRLSDVREIDMESSGELTVIGDRDRN